MPGGKSVRFLQNASQLIAANRPFKKWIRNFENLELELQNAICKRIVFFSIPEECVVKSVVRKRKAEDDASTVEGGILREREWLRKRGRATEADEQERVSTSTAVGCTNSDGASSNSRSESGDSISDDQGEFRALRREIGKLQAIVGGHVGGQAEISSLRREVQRLQEENAQLRSGGHDVRQENPRDS